MLPTMEDQMTEYGRIFRRCIKDGGEKDGPKLIRLAMRRLCQNDLFYLLAFVLGREDMRHQWIYERCMDVQTDPDGYLDLWAREHYKSTVITFGKTIQDILVDPNITVGIFSHTKSISRGFLRQIKFELEQNERLKRLFPEILYQNPRKDAPAAGNSWTDEGITVKRTQNSKEMTVEAHGVVDGQPTSRHFSLLVYDDIVTLESVSTPDQIAKTTEALAISYNLGAHGGKRRFIGTRYHFNDTYKTIMDRGTVTPRIHPATNDGKETGEPVLLSRESLLEKRRDMGPYVFGCLGAGTLVTMADWSQKPIEQVQIGDEVVGYAAVDGSKTTLTPTRVVATGSRIMPVVESVLEGGTTIVHTQQHKWWTGRTGDKTRTRKAYSPLGFAYNTEQKALCKAVDLEFLHEELSREQSAAAGYLAGMIDGEGGVRHRTLQITQDIILHPHICAKIEWALSALCVDYAVCDCDRRGKDRTRNSQGIQRTYTIHGGRQARVRLLHILGTFLGKRTELISQAYGSRNFGKGCRVALRSQVDAGEVEVFNIQTETGNYIANGFCSKNSQMLLNPTADASQGFQEEWLTYYETEPELADVNVYILVDPANEKKKASDYTVMWVVALAADRNYYVLDGIRDRLNLTQRTQALFQLHNEYQPEGVGYEHFGIQADIQHIQAEQERLNYRFQITPLSDTTPKPDRIRRLIPLFEQRRIIMPRSIWKTNYEGKRVNIIKEFVEDEYKPFPVMLHDDMLDDLANLRHPKMMLTFPKALRRKRKESWQDKLKRKLAELDRKSGTTFMSN